MQPRWRRCSLYADADLGEAVGQAYVARYFPPKNKERMLQMVTAIETALKQDIDAASWMSPQTKQFAHAKLTDKAMKAVGLAVSHKDCWRNSIFTH